MSQYYNINIFGYLGPGGGGGGGVLQKSDWAHIGSHRSILSFILFFIKSRGTGVTKMSVNADLITLETYVQQGEQLTTSFSYMGQTMNKNVHFYFTWGTFNDHTRPILLFRFPLTHSYK